MATLALENVQKVYAGNVRAVDGLTLAADDGELLVVVGPSGSGKTTLLRLIAGLEEPSAGTIAIDGRVVNRLAPRHRHVAMVFQDSVLYPHLSVYGNLAFGLKMRWLGRAQIAERVRQAAQWLRLGDVLRRRPAELSGGQRQRVALGRAVVCRPRLFLFDEPLAHLDAPLRAELRSEIRRLHARLGITTLYVTHDQTEAMTLGQRIAVLRAGRLQQAADPATLYQRPANRFVAGLIGSPPMNFFEGHVEDRDGRLVFDAGDFVLPIPATHRCRAGAYAGKPLTLGVRPEHVLPLDRAIAADECCARAAVTAVEPLGAETHVHLSTGSCTWICRLTAGQPVQAGVTSVWLLPPEHWYFFDPQTGGAVD